MKRKISYKYNYKGLNLAKFLLLAISLLILGMLLFIQTEAKKEFFDLVQTEVTFNILYLLSMFDLICFFELHYFSKRLKENRDFERILLCLFLMGIVQLFLCNLIISLILIYFILNALKSNHIQLKKLFRKVKEDHGWILPLIHLVAYTLFVLLMYVMILHRFTGI